jgi:hypothetical protein
MSIVFFCQSCGARFEVDPRMAGKKGRCKRCGQLMSIPRAEEIASMAAMPALAMAGVGAGVAPAPGSGVGGASIGARFQAGVSKLALAPITLDRMPIGPRKPSPLDVAEDSKPYALAQPVRQDRGRPRVQDNVVVRVWRRQLGGVQKLFRKINQTAYLVSVPFLMILLLGIVVGNRPMALLGATVVVLLNLGRIVAGGANLAVIPFRDGIDFTKMKKPLRRVIEPAVTIGLVVLAFTFIPWLSAGQSAKGSIADRIRSGARTLEKDMKGQVDQVVDVEKLGAQAQETLRELGDKAKDFDVKTLGAQAQETLKELGSSSSGGPAKEGTGGRIRSGVEALEKRTQEEPDQAKALNQPRQQP